MMFHATAAATPARATCRTGAQLSFELVVCSHELRNTCASYYHMPLFQPSLSMLDATKNQHLCEWLNHLRPSLTLIYLGRLSRDQLFAYLFILCGLTPTDRLPRPGVGWSFMSSVLKMLSLGPRSHGSLLLEGL